MEKQKRLERINRWLSLLANLGVVLGLVILIFEVRQNASLTRLTLDIQKNDLLVALELHLSNPDSAAAWMKSIYFPEEMTDVDLRLVEGPLVSLMLQWDYLFQMESAGLLDRKRVELHIMNSAPFYFGSRFGQQWWSRNGTGWQGTNMYAVAGPIIEGLDPRFMEKYFDSLRIEPAEGP